MPTGTLENCPHFGEHGPTVCPTGAHTQPWAHRGMLRAHNGPQWGPHSAHILGWVWAVPLGTHLGRISRRENNPTQQSPPAAAEEKLSRNAFRPPVNERAECEQYQVEVSTQHSVFPPHSGVRRREIGCCDFGLI
ncbi:hypothetical protein COCON_G00188830 [Conger conger]|uniref:Uncharacterized protein n=1 Tax=Conger conger TaxID=82655 RepID=A0A9Q1D2Q0_CONCO|nr:hypothetical protein COCON_G00188830 [Conger conger]